MIFSLVAMIGLEKFCITSACLQWLCHSGERTVARGPLVINIQIPTLFMRHGFPIFMLVYMTGCLLTITSHGEYQNFSANHGNSMLPQGQ